MLPSTSLVVSLDVLRLTSTPSSKTVTDIEDLAADDFVRITLRGFPLTVPSTLTSARAGLLRRASEEVDRAETASWTTSAARPSEPPSASREPVRHQRTALNKELLPAPFPQAVENASARRSASSTPRLSPRIQTRPRSSIRYTADLKGPKSRISTPFSSRSTRGATGSLSTPSRAFRSEIL
eukprot:scaffold2671_cov252-Pinguiococcus_pyrenoidosus.AAC.22